MRMYCESIKPLTFLNSREMTVLVTLDVLLAFLILCCFSQNENNNCEIQKRDCLQVAALIPARAGSKGIKNKNLSILGNETLLSRTLRIVHESKKFDSVWVLTDGEEIAKEAIKQKGKIHWRDPLTATDNATTVSAVKDFLIKQKGYDIIAIIQCTSPFLKKDFLDDALNIILQTNIDCVFSVTRSHQLRWDVHNDNYVFPINFNPEKRPRRQDWKGELVENGMFYFVKPRIVLENQLLQNNRCKTVEIPKHNSLEIDTEIDLSMARALLPLLENYSEVRQKIF